MAMNANATVKTVADLNSKLLDRIENLEAFEKKYPALVNLSNYIDNLPDESQNDSKGD
jgi:sulfur transfer protein SufE